ncbi:chromate transporter [Clostridium sardiniense]|uniref:chromate transporter n=1 Tax=Clostridium sardiniense TaxID=29369 RepID=UPI003D3487EE
MKDLFDLYLLFIKLGLMNFGGGYTMFPILQREIIEKRHWITDEELTDYYAIGQCTPGVIAVNTATFIGYKRKGSLGGIFATLGFVTPSVILISIIATFIGNFSDLPIVKDAFAGIRVCVAVLILNTAIKLLKTSVIDIKTLIVFVLVLGFSIFTNISPVLFIIIAGISGIVLKGFGGKKHGTN